MSAFSTCLRSLRHLAWPTPFGWLLLAGLPSTEQANLAVLPPLLLGLYQLWLNWRLQLDAALFARLERGELDLMALDRSLLQLFGRRLPPRTLEQRQAATRGLLQRYLLCTLLYWFFLIGIWLVWR